MKTFLLIYSRLPFPPIQDNPRGNVTTQDQPLEITVRAETEADAITQGQNIINYQIRGGPAPGVSVPPGFIPAGVMPYQRSGSPRIYTLTKVKVLYGK